MVECIVNNEKLVPGHGVFLSGLDWRGGKRERKQMVCWQVHEMRHLLIINDPWADEASQRRLEP
jgi:hypothetical protein